MVATPPVWTDPAGTAVDVANGQPWTTVAIDALCSALKFLGGADGASGIAGKLNLLVNGGFEVWQRGTSFNVTTTALTYTADRWAAAMVGTSTCVVSQNVTNLSGASQYSATLNYTHGTGVSQYVQKTEQWVALKGQAMALSMWVLSSVANQTRIGLFDGTSNNYSAYHPGDGLWHQLGTVATISASASVVQPFVSLEATGIVIVDSAMLVTGVVPAPFSPLRTADDLAACQRYYELLDDAGSGVLLIGGYQGAGGTAYTFLPFKAIKPAVPVVTVVGTWIVSNAGQPVVNTSTTRGTLLRVTVTALGYGYAQNGNSGNTVSVESNP